MIRFFPTVVPRLPLKTPLWRVAGLLALPALLAICGPTRLAAAPDDEESQQVKSEEEPGARFGGNINWLQQFDMIMFSAAGGAAKAQQHVDVRLTVQMDELDLVCRLSEAQRRKLLLAAAGDAIRFFYQVSELRRQFEAMGPEQNANAFGEVWQLVSPLQMKFQAGIFGETSLFSKAIRKTLTPDQMASYRVVLDSRARFRHQAQALAALVELEKTIPLESSQYEALLKLLLDHILPHESTSQEINQGLQLYWFAMLPQDKVRAIFDEQQRKQYQQICDQVEGLKPWLISQGVITGPDAENPVGE